MRKTFCDGCDTVVEGPIVELRAETFGPGAIDSIFHTGKSADLHEGCIEAWLSRIRGGAK